MIHTIPLAGDILLCTQSVQAAQRSLSQGKPNGRLCPAQALDIQRRPTFIRCVLALNEISDTCLSTVWYHIPKRSVRSIV